MCVCGVSLSLSLDRKIQNKKRRRRRRKKKMTNNSNNNNTNNTNNTNNSHVASVATSGTISSSGPLVPQPGLGSSQSVVVNPLSASTGSAPVGGASATSTTVVIDIGQYLSPPVIRNLSDKLYEKRKLGALEVEQFVRDAAQHKEKDKLYAVTQFLTENFCGSSNANLRKGGLIALAAVAIGLGPISFSNFF